MIRYRRAESKDLSRIADIYYKTFSPIFKKYSCDRNAVSDVIKLYMDASEGGLIAAKDNGKIIGAVCGVKSVLSLWKKIIGPRFFKFVFTPRGCFIMPPSFKHIFSGHVPLMFVSKEYRLRGIGLKLVDEVMKYFKSCGVKVVYFQIPHRLVKPYTEHGAKAVGWRKEWVVMSKRVA